MWQQRRKQNGQQTASKQQAKREAKGTPFIFIFIFIFNFG